MKKPSSRLRLIALAFLAAFALIAAACGDSNTATTTNEPAPTTTASDMDDMADTTTTAASDMDDSSMDDMADDTTTTTAAPSCDMGDMSMDDMADSSMDDSSMDDMADGQPVTQGPNGEPASPSSEIVLSDDEVAQVKDAGCTAALVWHLASAFTDAVSKGARETFEALGIEVISETEAGFDPAQQANDVETVLAQDPDIILTLVVDTDSGAVAFRPAVDAGVQLVLLSNVPKGYVQGEDYVGLVTDDLAAMGIAAADLMADALGGSGQIGYIFHDAAYYVTNQRDQAFKAWIENNYPDIQIVDEQGTTGGDAEAIASAMLTRNPDLNGIYTPWSAGPGDGALAALRAAGASDVALVTMDLDTNVSLDMVEGGNVVGIATDEAYEIGRAMATEGAYGLLGKAAPPFVIVPGFGATADNIVEAYQRSLKIDPPQEVLDALAG